MENLNPENLQQLESARKVAQELESLYQSVLKNPLKKVFFIWEQNIQKNINPSTENPNGGIETQTIKRERTGTNLPTLEAYISKIINYRNKGENLGLESLWDKFINKPENINIKTKENLSRSKPSSKKEDYTYFVILYSLLKYNFPFNIMDGLAKTILFNLKENLSNEIINKILLNKTEGNVSSPNNPESNIIIQNNEKPGEAVIQNDQEIQEFLDKLLKDSDIIFLDKIVLGVGIKAKYHIFTKTVNFLNQIKMMNQYMGKKTKDILKS